MNFEPINYTSKILWHFISAKEGGEDPLSILKEKIFDNSSDNLILKSNPSNSDDYYSRKYNSGTQGNNNVFNDQLPRQSENVDFRELKAICFADIPLPFLSIHLNRYENAVGIGFSREVLQKKLGANIQPIRYFHSVDHKFWNDCKNFSDCVNKTINGYYKLPSIKTSFSLNEDFNSIYMEREWRTLDKGISIKIDDVDFILLRNKTDNLKDEQFKKLQNSGVSILYIDSLFNKK